MAECTGLFCGTIFNNINVFLVFMILLAGIIGAFSRRLIIISFGGFLIFVEIFRQTDLFIFDGLATIIIISGIAFVGFRVISFALGTRGDETI